MTARLPVPGKDDGTWGDILNEYLQVAHSSDGSLKPISLSDVTGLSAVLSDKVNASDARLSDERTPSDSSVTDAKVAADAAISADKLADGTTNKIMTASERSLLGGATILDTGSTLVKRDGSGKTNFQRVYSTAGPPVGATELTRKDYVDANGSASPADAPNISGSNNLGSPTFAPPKVRVMTMTGNVTIVGTPSSIGATRAGVTVLVFKQAASGGPYTITWPDSTTLPWAGGAAAPSMPTAANAELEVHLFWTGQSWRAKVGGTYFP